MALPSQRPSDVGSLSNVLISFLTSLLVLFRGLPASHAPSARASGAPNSLQGPAHLGPGVGGRGRRIRFGLGNSTNGSSSGIWTNSFCFLSGSCFSLAPEARNGDEPVGSEYVDEFLLASLARSLSPAEIPQKWADRCQGPLRPPHLRAGWPGRAEAKPPVLDLRDRRPGWKAAAQRRHRGHRGHWGRRISLGSRPFGHGHISFEPFRRFGVHGRGGLSPQVADFQTLGFPFGLPDKAFQEVKC